MSFEICQKCHNKLQLTKTSQGYTLCCYPNIPVIKYNSFVKFMTFDEGDKLINNSELILTRKDKDDDYLEFFWIYLKNNEFTQKLFKELKIEESCPYYMEHQLSKWNK